jgi:regulator of protease activity HflC (stomatin/prohibitin superfamily)
LKQRQQRQQAARESIHAALNDYNVEAVDTLIGDINPPEALMKTLTDRKVAEQQRITFETQEASEDQRKKLEQARAMANTQASVVDAERSVTIQEFRAKASIAEADGLGQSTVIRAEAEAKRVTVTGNAQAAVTLAIGTAEAEVVKQKINSMESGNYAAIETAKALAASGKPLVPNIVMSSSSTGGGGNNDLVSMLLLNMINQDEERKVA